MHIFLNGGLKSSIPVLMLLYLKKKIQLNTSLMQILLCSYDYLFCHIMICLVMLLNLRCSLPLAVL